MNDLADIYRRVEALEDGQDEIWSFLWKIALGLIIGLLGIVGALVGPHLGASVSAAPFHTSFQKDLKR